MSPVYGLLRGPPPTRTVPLGPSPSRVHVIADAAAGAGGAAADTGDTAVARAAATAATRAKPDVILRKGVSSLA
ncbi:hypothetical protein GCM10010232_52860 [Streptomyces amakusaensis]